MSVILKDALKKKRDSLSDSSITTYSSVLYNLHKNLFGEEVDLDNFNKVEKIIDALKKLPPNKCKTTLSGLVVLTGNMHYREAMLDKINAYNVEVKTQEKSEKQKLAWVSKDEIEKKYKDLKTDAEALYKKSKLSIDDLQNIQQYIILALMGGIFVVPRRSEYVKVKITAIDKKIDNYIEKNSFVFNSYKTSNFYGTQTLAIPTALMKILKKWLSVNPTDYLLFDNNYNKLNNITFNQRINRIFEGKKVGINGLRHTYLTYKHGDIIEKDAEIASDLKKMGSSMSQKQVYIKKDKEINV